MRVRLAAWSLVMVGACGPSGASTGSSSDPDSESDGGGPDGCGDGIVVPGVFCFEEVEAFGPASNRSFEKATPLGDGRILLVGYGGELTLLEARGGLVVAVVTLTLPPHSEDGGVNVWAIVAELDGDPEPEIIASKGQWAYLLDIHADAIELLELRDTGLSTSLVAIDVDGDGLDEVVGAYPDFDVWKVVPGQPWDKTQITMPNPPCDALRRVVADFDGDGADDMIVIASTDGRSGCPDTFDDTYVLLNRFAQRGAEDPFDVTLAPSLGFSPSLLHAADIDGDGAIDLASVSSSTHPASMLRGRGDGTFEGPIDLGFLSWGSAAVGDFDGDGTADILAPHRVGMGEVLEFRRSADGFEAVEQGPQQHDILGATDINGDGVDDILFGSTPAKLLLSNP